MCASPKFYRALKSTVCEISSSRDSVITFAYGALFPAVVGLACTLLPFTTQIAPGKPGTAATTICTEPQASQAQTRSHRQIVLGSCPSVVASMEAFTDDRDSRNCCALASGRIPNVLEHDLEGEK